MDLTPKQQTSEAIRQAETILVLTGQHPSVDQVTGVMALASVLRRLGKQVTAIVSDNPPAAVASLELEKPQRNLGGARDFILKVSTSKAQIDKLRYEMGDGSLDIHLTPLQGNFAPSDVTFGYGDFHFDLAIVLGVPTRGRIDRFFEQNVDSFASIPIVNLDFHRSNESFGAVNLIEPTASSICEMLVALSESLQAGPLDEATASALLMGIMASTDRFTATHTTPKSLTVAAQMMAAGAKQQAIVRALYRDGKGEARPEPARDNGRDGARSDVGRGDRDRNNERERNGNRDGSRDGGREGGRDNRAPQREQGRPEAQRPNSRPEPARAEPPQAPRPQPERIVEAPRPEPVREQPAPMQNVAVFDEVEPILPPAHIEMSSREMGSESVEDTAMAGPEARPEAVATTAPQTVQASTMPAQARVESAPAAAPATDAEPSRPAPVLPMADFAAAAEMFNQDRADERFDA